MARSIQLGNFHHCLLAVYLVMTLIAAVFVAFARLDHQVPAIPGQEPGISTVTTVPIHNLPPTATVTPANGTIRVGERIVLSAEQSYDPDGEIARYRWSFAHGSSIAASRITVQFSTAGTKTVVLTVTDDRGAQAFASASIEVLRSPPGPVLLLSVGPVNVFEMAPGAAIDVELHLAAFNQPVTGLDVVILSDGGLAVESTGVPDSLSPCETATLRLKIRAPENLRDPVGTVVLIEVRSDQTVSNVERLEVTIPGGSSLSGLPLEVLETISFMAAVIAICIVLRRRERR